MDGDQNDDIPDFSEYFTNRANNSPHLSLEELQDAARYLKRLREEFQREPMVEVTVSFPKKRKTKASVEKKSAETEVIPVPDDIPSSSSLPLSAASKRRLRKTQRDFQKELRSVEAANSKVLSSLLASDLKEIENEDNERYLTILYLTEISTLKYDEDEKFSDIFQRVADLLHLKVSEFRLCVKNRNIKLDDTPKSLNLSHSDIIECIPYKSHGNEAANSDTNKLQLFFQASDTKKKTEMFVHQLEVMQDIMEKYSKIRSIPLDQMLFEFDGEKISGTETPEGLDMEAGSCIDVKILNADDKLSRKGSNINSEIVIDLTEASCSSSDPNIIFCE